MANYNNLKADIDAVIKTNGRQEISGAALNAQLKNMIAELGAGYQYMGVATPATNPGTPDANVFYLASEAGTYTNFGGIVINDGEVCALVWNGTWTKQVTGAATEEQLNRLGQKVIEKSGEEMLSKPVVKVGDADIDYRFSYNIDANTGVASSGGYRSVVLNFLPVFSTFDISIASGFLVNVLWYSEPNESSFIRSENYTQRATYTRPTGAKYFRMVFQRVGNSSRVTEPFSTIVTNLLILGYYDKVETLDNYSVKVNVGQSFNNEQKQRGLLNLGAMSYRSVSYQFCLDSADSVNKNVNVDLLESPNKGVRLVVQMSNDNTANDVTMSINSGTQYPLYFNGLRASGSNSWLSGACLDIVFDGERFHAIPFAGLTSEEGSSQNLGISQFAFTNRINIENREKIEKELSTGKPLGINTFTTWLMGTTDNPSATNRAHMSDLLQVTPGHRYAIVCSKYFWTNIAGWRPDFASEITGAIHYGSWNYNVYNTFIVPKDRNYVRIDITKQYGETITIDDAVKCNITIVDVTGSISLGENGSKITPLAYSSSMYSQGLACHVGYLFQAWSNGKLGIYNTTGEFLETIDLPTIDGSTLHCNSLGWGDFYDASDEFPLLIISANDWGQKIPVFRISRNGNSFSVSKIYEIMSPSAPTGFTMGSQYIDVQRKRMICVGYDEEDNVTLSEYSWSGGLNSETIFTLIKTAETGLYLWAMQDGILVDGIFYFIYGIANNHMFLCAYNTESETLEKFTDLRRCVFGTIKDEEPEGVDYSEGSVYFSTTKGIYKCSL